MPKYETVIKGRKEGVCIHMDNQKDAYQSVFFWVMLSDLIY